MSLLCGQLLALETCDDSSFSSPEDTDRLGGHSRLELLKVKATNQTVARKLILDFNEGDFMQEVQVLDRIKFLPHCIHYVCHDLQKHSIVTDYFPGSLMDFDLGDPMTSTFQLLYQVLQAVEELQSLEIAHLDLDES